MSSHTEIYANIRNLQDKLDYKDDIVAKKDHTIYLIQKGSYIPSEDDKIEEFKASKEYLNTDIDIPKYFMTVYELDIEDTEFNKKVKKIVRDLEFEIGKRDELIANREEQIKQLLNNKQTESMTVESPKPKLYRIVRNGIHILRHNGIKEFVRKFFRKLKNFLSKAKPNSHEQTDGRKRIAYVVNALAVSGGMQIVIRHVNELKKRGYDVIIMTFAEYTPSPWLKVDVPVYQVSDCNEEFTSNIDIMVATHWSTVPYVSLSNTKRRVYFVQSDERRFILEKKYKNNLIKYIEETYKADMEFMTEAIWIQRWLKEEFGKDAYYVPNGLDTEIFYKTEPMEPKGKKPRVLIEGQIKYWLKGMEEAYEAVKDLDCELWIISSWGKPPEHWKYDKFFEKIPFNEMRNVYSSCDIFLKMSKVEGFFGPPMEAMTCGCAVVVNKVSGYDEYIKHGENALVVEPGDVQGARDAVKRLIDDESLRDKLVSNGSKVAKDWSWERSIDFLEEMVEEKPIDIMYTEDYPERYIFEKELEKIEEYLERREKLLFS